MFLYLLGGLGVFLLGLEIMSEGLQKTAGQRLRKMLAMATANRFAGTLSGFAVTSVIQSSSATTVMVVGFASAGLLTLSQSLGVIFGANIGTTVTAWIVSLLGFKVKIAAFALPLIGIGYFSRFIKRWRWPHRFGEVMVGFGLLFLGLELIKDGIPDLRNSPEVLAWIAKFSPDSILPLLALIGVGTALTVIFQSSSAVMAVTIAAAAKGIIDFPSAAALVLGENIGTTVTANLAAIGASNTAKQAAIGHFLFNVLGVVWATIFFGPMIEFVDAIIPGAPYGTSEAALLVAIPLHISAFHTVFNVINTGIMLPFIKQFERLILFVKPDIVEKGPPEHELVYLTTPFARAPELAIDAARREIDHLAGVVTGMMAKISGALADGKIEDHEVDAIKADEKTTDVLEHKINDYLASLVHERLSNTASREVLSLMSMINDFEKMGDYGEKIANLLGRTREPGFAMSAEAYADLIKISGAAREMLEETRSFILKPEGDIMERTWKRENELNRMRNEFRENHLLRICDGRCKPSVGPLYSDLLNSFEKMGDHAVNVAEALTGLK
ncbi:MAG: phosphate:Na+ symporter [Elusimicrobia bacterium]|nr:MAG: phosphate:Na+ symporter [Elusimicrobiota bacterium]KAF0154370.1 MAG: phosphate:Na+ symporter [Elusimicrobiota bacterium]